MAFNKKKFLEAILDLSATQAPALPPARQPLTPSFAKFMASKTYGASDSTDASILGAKESAVLDDEREEGALSKTFGWLMSSMNQVENSVMDLTNDNLDTSEKLSALGEDWAAAGAHWLQPLAEVAAIPGVKVPWEPEALSDFVKKHNTEYHGTGPISGSRILEERLGLDPKHNIRNALLGFGVDIALDPLSYVGVGLPGKLKKGTKLIENVSKEASGSAKAFTKPNYSIKLQSPLITNRNIPNVTKPKSVRGINTSKFLADKLNITDPADLKQIQISNLADFRWHEKLHPISFTPKIVPKNPQFAKYETIGNDIVKTFPEFTEEAARAIPRSEQQLLFNMVASKIGDLPLSTPAQWKYLAKGAEDALESRGYTFPEGKLSEYLHSTKNTDIATFSKGKPLKERPMDASMEAKLAEIRKAQGRHLLESKLAKKSPSKAFTAAHGINSRVVSDAIDNLAKAPDEVIYRIPKATEPSSIKTAVAVADKTKAELAGKAFSPREQATLYNKLLKSAGGRQTIALQMLKVAEDHLSKSYALRGVQWDGSSLPLSSVIEQLGPNATDEMVGSIIRAFSKKSANKVTDEFAKQTIAKAIAKRSMESGAVAKTIFDDFVDTSKIVEREVSHQKVVEWKQNQALKRVQMSSAIAGLSKAEAERVIDLVKNQINTEGLELMEPMKMLDEVGKRAIDSVMNGTAQPDLIAKVGKAIQESVGETPKFQRTDLTARSALDTVLMRMTTWYGRGEMIHSSRESYSFIEDWAKARADWFNNIAKSYSPNEIAAAFKHAQGHYDNIEIAIAKNGVTTPVVTERVAYLSGKFKDYFENIMASTRTINDESKLKGSVAVRAEIMMDDINKQLKATNTTFQFTGKARTTSNLAGNPAGKGLGYGGDHWMLSWENVDPTKLGQDPLHFMYDLSLAVDRVTTEYSIIDDFVVRFGRKLTDSDHIPTMTKTIPHHRIAKDIYFEPKTADDFMNLLKDVEKGNWFPDAKFLRQLVKGQRLWKTGVTQYNPSFHIRNFIGDSFLMWLAGHNDPRMFTKAERMISANRARYKDAVADPNLEVLQGFMSREDYGILQSSDDTVILKKYGADLTSAEIYGEALQRGLLLDASRASDIIGEPLFKNVHGRNPSAKRRFITAPLGGKAHATVMGATEIREHFVRLAHFTSVVNKSITRSQASKLKAIASNPKIGNKVAARREILKDVYEKASREVRKWHPDGRDLSYFEQKYFRSIPIPFYSWQRKIIPLLIESMAIRPGKLTVYPKGMFALQQALGIDAPGISDPFPKDQLYPLWMRSLGIGPIGDPESNNPVAAWFGKLGRNSTLGSSDESGYTVINPGNPFNDTVSQFGGEGTTIPNSIIKASSILSPYFNIPKEFLSDSKWTGAPISTEAGGAGYPNWLLSQIPVASTANRITNVGAKQTENVEQGTDTEALINILTALGIKGSGQYQKSSEFEKKYGIGYGGSK